MVVREPDGVLRFATPEERDRALHIYYPRTGKMYTMPKMFNEDQLEVCHISLVFFAFFLNCHLSFEWYFRLLSVIQCRNFLTVKVKVKVKVTHLL